MRICYTAWYVGMHHTRMLVHACVYAGNKIYRTHDTQLDMQVYRMQVYVNIQNAFMQESGFT